MPAHLTPIGWKDLANDLQRRRTGFISDALADTKRWCTAPDVPVRGKTSSDQHWLQLFSSESASVSGGEVQRFLVTYNLARWVTWNTDNVAVRIREMRNGAEADTALTVGQLAEELKADIRTGTPSKQTSAASKLAFFTLPSREFYIWDQFAMRATRCRDWLREGAQSVPRRFDRPYTLRGTHDYGAFGAACSAALKDEMRKGDFSEAAGELREYFLQVEGPLADRSRGTPDTFIERRFLDKLLFWEGQHLASISVLAA